MSASERRMAELLEGVMEQAEPVFLTNGFEIDEYVISVSLYEEICEYLADRAALLATDGPVE